MSDEIRELSATVRSHLKKITRSSGLPDTEESFQKMVAVWLEKKKMFEGQIRALDMEEVDSFSKDDPRGALLLSYSGSLISLGTLSPGGRRVEYASISLRADVPHLAVTEGSALAADIRIDSEAEFSSGKVRSTSSLLKIAVCGTEVSPEEQEKRIREATIFLTNGFVKINRTVLSTGADLPDQFTSQAIIAYLARKNGLTQKQARQITSDYLTMIESGMILGERVPLGKIGRLFLKKRPPRKARVVVNPATGKEITVPARPEEAVPKISFSRSMKERARQVEMG
ncbi:MAG: HU family DNA-binding protein [Spirochaetaceae bacterium]|nr:MAG: HU family DNA-binding protein [Spirochaetaceae bacterium]